MKKNITIVTDLVDRCIWLDVSKNILAKEKVDISVWGDMVEDIFKDQVNIELMKIWDIGQS